MFYDIIVIAQAQKAGAQGGPPQWLGVLPMFVVLGVMLFFLFRSQKKQANQRREMLSKIKAGDEVVTNGGIKGTIAKVKEKTYLLKIADKVEIEIVQSGIGAVIGDKTEDKTNE